MYVCMLNCEVRTCSVTSVYRLSNSVNVKYKVFLDWWSNTVKILWNCEFWAELFGLYTLSFRWFQFLAKCHEPLRTELRYFLQEGLLKPTTGWLRYPPLTGPVCPVRCPPPLTRPVCPVRVSMPPSQGLCVQSGVSCRPLKSLFSLSSPGQQPTLILMLPVSGKCT